jgi:hypothetical protein
MAVVLRIIHQALPPLGAPAFLVIGGLVAPLVFLSTWAILLGGSSDLMELISDIRSALGKRMARNVKSVEPGVSNEAALS